MALPANVTAAAGRGAPAKGFRSLYDPTSNTTYRVPLADFAGAANPRSVAQRFLQRSIATERGTTQAALRTTVAQQNRAAGKPGRGGRTPRKVRNARRASETNRRSLTLPGYGGIESGSSMTNLRRNASPAVEGRLWRTLAEWVAAAPWDGRLDVGLLWPAELVKERKQNTDPRGKGKEPTPQQRERNVELDSEDSVYSFDSSNLADAPPVPLTDNMWSDEFDDNFEMQQTLQREYSFWDYMGSGSRLDAGGHASSYLQFMETVPGFTLSGCVAVMVKVGTSGAPGRNNG